MSDYQDTQHAFYASFHITSNKHPHHECFVPCREGLPINLHQGSSILLFHMLANYEQF